MKLVFAVLITAILSSCASTQKPITDESYALAQLIHQQNKTLNSWFMLATVSFSNDDEAYFFNAVWQRQPHQFELLLNAPLSQGSVEIKGFGLGTNTQGASLQLNNNPTIYGISAEELIQKSTQFNIPVSGLDYWVRGIAHPNSTSDNRINFDGTTLSLKQDGWNIHYSEWDKVNIKQATYWLPRQIKLRQADFKIQIRPSQWSPPNKPYVNPLFSDLND